MTDRRTDERQTSLSVALHGVAADISSTGVSARRIMVVADSDTRLKWAVRVAEALARTPGVRAFINRDDPIEVVLLCEGAVPSIRQLSENRISVPQRVLDEDAVSSLIDERPTIIVCCTVGSRLHLVTELVRSRFDGEPDRPLVVTGYAGIVYEKHIEGALWRSSADVVCCNSNRDHREFAETYSALALDANVLVRTGLGVTNHRSAAEIAAQQFTSTPSTVVFAVQPDVPRSLRERRYLLERLVAYARAHSGRTVIVKLRSRPDESTTHLEKHHYEEIYRRHVSDRPGNLRFEYGLMSDVLARTDLLITVSSTAVVEALAHGCRGVVLTDFGVRADLGNHFFVGSGLLCSMDDVTADRLPDVDVEWLDDNGFGSEDSMQALTERVAEQLRCGLGPVSPAFYSPTRTPYAYAWMDAETPTAPSATSRVRAKRIAAHLVRMARNPYRRLVRWVES
jgi:hypothetical protein